MLQNKMKKLKVSKQQIKAKYSKKDQTNQKLKLISKEQMKKLKKKI